MPQLKNPILVYQSPTDKLFPSLWCMYKKVIDIAHALLLLVALVPAQGYCFPLLHVLLPHPPSPESKRLLVKVYPLGRKCNRWQSCPQVSCMAGKPHTKNKHNKNKVKIVHTIIGFPLNVFTSSLKYLYA